MRIVVPELPQSSTASGSRSPASAGAEHGHRRRPSGRSPAPRAARARRECAARRPRRRGPGWSLRPRRARRTAARGARSPCPPGRAPAAERTRSRDRDLGSDHRGAPLVLDMSRPRRRTRLLRQVVTERSGTLEVHVVQLVAAALRVAVHEEPDAHGLPAVDAELAGAQQRDVAEPERRGRRRPGTPPCRSSVAVKMMLTMSSCSSSLRSSSSLTRRWVFVVDLLLGVLVARDRAAQRPKPHAARRLPLAASRTVARRLVAGFGRGGVQRPDLRGRSARHDPGARRRSAIGPTRVRTSRRTGWPTASHMRRTCRLRPSWIDDLERGAVAAVLHDARTRAGAVGPSSSVDALAQRRGSWRGSARRRPRRGTSSRRRGAGG